MVRPSIPGLVCGRTMSPRGSSVELRVPLLGGTEGPLVVVEVGLGCHTCRSRVGSSDQAINDVGLDDRTVVTEVDDRRDSHVVVGRVLCDDLASFPFDLLDTRFLSSVLIVCSSRLGRFPGGNF